MDVQIDAPGGLRRQMTVRIPAEQVTRALDERLTTLSRRAKIPGFRPGKAPLKVIQQQFGESARADVVSDLVQKTYPEALDRSGIQPVSPPRISITAEKAGDALEYVASFEVFPDISVGHLDQMRVERPAVEIADADIDRLIANLLKARQTFHPAERASEHGDRVVIDYVGTLDGEPFQGGKADGATIEIGAGQVLPDLESGLVARSVGETFEVPVTFPADYGAEALRGQTASFAVTVREVRAARSPAVDAAEFLAAHGAETVAALRDKSRQALENERNKAIRQRVKAQVLDQLLTLNPIEVPKSLVEQEIPRLRAEAAQRMNIRGVPPEKLTQMLPDGLFEQSASRRVALGLLIADVIKQRQVKLDGARVEQALEDLANDYEDPAEVKAFYHGRPELMQGLRSAVLEEQVVENLVSEVAVTEAPMSLEQLLNRP